MPLQKARYTANSTAEIEGILTVHEWQGRQGALHRKKQELLAHLVNFTKCVI